MVEPSCPALLIFDDDAFRKSLISTLDQKHFTVTSSREDEAVKLLESEKRAFHVVLIGVDLDSKRGVEVLKYLEGHREKIRCGVIIIGEANPQLRTFAPWVDETLMKPVDPDYIAKRARTYCNC